MASTSSTRTNSEHIWGLLNRDSYLDSIRKQLRDRNWPEDFSRYSDEQLSGWMIKSFSSAFKPIEEDRGKDGTIVRKYKVSLKTLKHIGVGPHAVIRLWFEELKREGAIDFREYMDPEDDAYLILVRFGGLPAEAPTPTPAPEPTVGRTRRMMILGRRG